MAVEKKSDIPVSHISRRRSLWPCRRQRFSHDKIRHIIPRRTYAGALFLNLEDSIPTAPRHPRIIEPDLFMGSCPVR